MPEDNQSSESNTLPLEEHRQYMIAPRPGQIARAIGLEPMAADAMDQMLSTLGLDVIRRIKRNPGTMQML